MLTEQQMEIAATIRDMMPEQCQDCGGYLTDDSTPKWVYREEVCECGADNNDPRQAHDYDQRDAGGARSR